MSSVLWTPNSEAMDLNLQNIPKEKQVRLLENVKSRVVGLSRESLQLTFFVLSLDSPLAVDKPKIAYSYITTPALRAPESMLGLFEKQVEVAIASF